MHSDYATRQNTDAQDVVTRAEIVEIGDIAAGEEIQVMIPYLGVSSADYTLVSSPCHAIGLDRVLMVGNDNDTLRFARFC